MFVLEDNFRSMTTTCPHCKSVLKMDHNDINGGDVCKPFYKCMACNKTSNLEYDQIPYHIRVSLWGKG